MKKLLNRITISLICVFLLSQTVSAAESLVPGGYVIGLELKDGTVTVAAFDETLGANAQASGLQVGDKITQIDKQDIHSAEDVRHALERANGSVQVNISRSGKTKHLQLTPVITKEGPKLGIYLKQGVTGVGTVTWYDPATGDFGALGHGVNTQDGTLLPMQDGKAYTASILSVKKGQAGDPGQLMGTLEGTVPIGTLNKNTCQGIFGTSPAGWKGQSLPVASADEVHTGEAVIRSTVHGNQVQEYSVEILKIYPTSGSTGRNLLLKVTDPALLNLTGGIVQGMSGSPIIQNGKLIGAVTHVLVNQPDTGYGIFIENMLDAAAA